MKLFVKNKEEIQLTEEEKKKLKRTWIFRFTRI